MSLGSQYGHVRRGFFTNPELERMAMRTSSDSDRPDEFSGCRTTDPLYQIDLRLRAVEHAMEVERARIEVLEAELAIPADPRFTEAPGPAPSLATTLAGIARWLEEHPEQEVAIAVAKAVDGRYVHAAARHGREWSEVLIDGPISADEAYARLQEMIR
jgi:hypothetical protein